MKVYNDSPIEDSFGKYFSKDGIKDVKATELKDL